MKIYKLDSDGEVWIQFEQKNPDIFPLLWMETNVVMKTPDPLPLPRLYGVPTLSAYPLVRHTIPVNVLLSHISSPFSILLFILHSSPSPAAPKKGWGIRKQMAKLWQTSEHSSTHTMIHARMEYRRPFLLFYSRDRCIRRDCIHSGILILCRVLFLSFSSPRWAKVLKEFRGCYCESRRSPPYSERKN